MDEDALRELICEVGRRLYARNLVAGTDGNVSVRLGPDRYLCTRSGVSKGFMTAEDIVMADGNGNKVSGAGAVSTEFFTHLAAYEEREDVMAVVHAHPPQAVALTLAGLGMEDAVLPEVVYALGTVAYANYATPGTREGAEVIRGLIRGHDAVLLDRHGAVTVGRDVMEAYLKMERVEHAAEILVSAHLLSGARQGGRLRALTEGQIAKLRELGSGYSAQ